MLTEKDYCDYETCVALKELGYPLFSKEVRYEDKAVFVPGVLLYSAQKWLREEKHLHIEVRWYSNLLYEYKVKEAAGETLAVVTAFKTYEEALSEGLRASIKILQNGQKENN